MGSLLETFFILFESDAKEVKKGAEEAERSTDKLQNKINSTDAASQRLGKSFLMMVRAAVTSLAAIVSVGAVIGGVFNAARLGNELDRASKSLEINVEELSVWGDAVKDAGGTIDGFISTVKTLSANMAQLDITGRSKVQPFFKELGVSMLDSSGKARQALEVFPEIAEAFEKISKQQSAGIGRKLGFDEGTIMLLQKGRREVEAVLARQRELGVVTQKQAEIAALYDKQLGETRHAFRSFYFEIATGVLPVLTKLLKGFEKIAIFARENGPFMIAFFGTLTAVLGGLAVSAGLVSLPFIGIALAVGLAIAAIALLIEDLYRFNTGAESVIGNVWKLWLNFIESIRQGAHEIGDIILGIFNEVLDDVAKLITGIIELIAGAADKFSAAIGLKGAFGNIGTLQAVGSGQQQLSTAGSAALSSVTSNSISNAGSRFDRSNSVSIGKVEVVTQATDAQGMANGASSALTDQMRQTLNNYDDGVAM